MKHGRNTLVMLDGFDLSPYLTGADPSVEADTVDVSTFGNLWKASIAGQVASKADFTGFYDPILTNLPALLGVDPGAVLTYAPAGALAIGDRAHLMSAMAAQLATSSPIGGAVAIKWAVLASGAVGFGDVLHIPSTDGPGTTTGASKDDAAQSTTGAVAHLHVTAVSSGSWVVTIEDSANGSSGWATIGTFAAKTAPGGQRIVIAGTVRRYVRYVATVTGGASPTVAFTLAYART